MTTIQSSGSHLGGISLMFSSYNEIINNVCSTNTGYGIRSMESGSNQFVNNIITDNRIGISLVSYAEKGGEGVENKGDLITGNIISNNSYGIYAVRVKGLEVHGNEIAGNKDFGILFYPWNGVSINATNNWWGSEFGPYHYEKNPSGMGDLVTDNVNFEPWIGMEAIPPPRNLTEAYVLESAPEYGDGTKERPYGSIMRALYDVRQGGTVYIWEGMYFEHLIIRKSVNLIGNESNVTIIESGVFGDTISIQANNVTLDGINISAAKDGFYYQIARTQSISDNSCLKVESSNNTISNCTFYNGQTGIWLENANNNVIENTICTNNKYGIYLSSSKYNTISGNINSNNRDYHWGTGIYIGNNSNRNTISNNTCFANMENGIEIRSSDECNAEYNTCSNNTIGIMIFRSNSTRIEYNQCIKNKESGIDVQRSNDVIISRNICYSNQLHGIIVSGDSEGSGEVCRETLLRNNDCSENWISGIALVHTIQSTLMNNTMVFNGLTIGPDPIVFLNSHAIDETNTVNGKPIIYYVNRTGGRVSEDVGQVILVNCSDMVIENQIFEYCTSGIALNFCYNVIIENVVVEQCNAGINIAYSKNITISKINCRANVLGLVFIYSNNNILINSTISSNGRELIIEELTQGGTIPGGFIAISSHNNTISNNEFSNEFIGMGFVQSSNNTITNNTITGNEYGAYFLHNFSSFIYNFQQYQSNMKGNFRYYGKNVLHYNEIFGNEYEGVISNELNFNEYEYDIPGNEKFIVDARYNWWGHNSGPSPRGKGDGVTGNVEFSPWLDNEGNLRYPEDNGKYFSDYLDDFVRWFNLFNVLLITLVMLCILLTGVVIKVE